MAEHDLAEGSKQARMRARHLQRIPKLIPCLHAAKTGALATARVVVASASDECRQASLAPKEMQKHYSGIGEEYDIGIP
jgi:hypothetical protein